MALHTFPNAATNFAFCELIVGYAFEEIIEVKIRERRANHLDTPDQSFPRISFDPLVSAPERFAVVPCCSADG